MRKDRLNLFTYAMLNRTDTPTFPANITAAYPRQLVQCETAGDFCDLRTEALESVFKKRTTGWERMETETQQREDSRSLVYRVQGACAAAIF